MKKHDRMDIKDIKKCQDLQMGMTMMKILVIEAILIEEM
jgi:hypothetical protein